MMNESVKKSLEKSKNVLEEKLKIVKQKFALKKTNVYNNCYELRTFKPVKASCIMKALLNLLGKFSKF